MDGIECEIHLYNHYLSNNLLTFERIVIVLKKLIENNYGSVICQDIHVANNVNVNVDAYFCGLGYHSTAQWSCDSHVNQLVHVVH